MKFKSLFALIVLAAATAFSAKLQEYSIVVQPNGSAVVSFINKFPFLNGVGTLEGRSDRTWVPLQNFFIVDQRVGQVVLPLPVYYTTNTVFNPTNSITTTNYTTNSIYPELRLRSVSIERGGFKNLALVYGNIDTVAGNGEIPPRGTNAWLPQYEGTNATAVTFSDPRAIVADAAGNIYVSEHDSHAISVIDSNGIIRTAVGTRVADFLLDEFPIPGPFSPLNQPSGLWLTGNKLYILDNGNGRVVIYTNGFASTVFYDTNGIANGNGLWVSNDGLEAYYTDGTKLKRWRFDVGVEVIGTNYVNLASVTLNPESDVIVADRGGHVLWEVNNDGVRQIVAGTRFPGDRPRLGEADRVPLTGPSSVWYMPFGGYLVGLDQGTSVWYVDSGGTTARLVFGAPGVHDGDGDWFQRGRTRPKISNVKSLTVEPFGDILILEGGYVRRINFLRHKP